MSAAAAAAEAPAPKKSAGKKKLLMIVAAAVLVLGGSGVGALLFMKKQQAAAAAAADDGDDAAAAPAHKKDEKKEKPVFVPMDPFVVNLADHDADRYAQIGITLEVPDEHASEDIKAYLPAIRNNILLLLAHKSSADLSGGEGMAQLAREIRATALSAMGVDVPEEDSAASAASGVRKKKKKTVNEEDFPIRSVQFSSFIIQ